MATSPWLFLATSQDTDDFARSQLDNPPRLHDAMREFFAIAEAEDLRHLEPVVS